MITKVQTSNGDIMLLPMDSIVQWIMDACNSYPIVGVLFLLMVIDVAVGFGAALITKSVSSTVSQNGMVRKAINLLLIGAAAVIEPYAGGIPVSKMIAGAFIVTELISITENAIRAGVPVPQSLIDTLQKLRNNEKPSVDSKQVQQQVTIGRASSVDIHTTDESSVKKTAVDRSQDSQITIIPKP